MQFSEVLHASREALRGNRLRTGLTMLGIIIGISSVITISSIGQGAVAFITNELSSFGTNFFQITPGEGFLGAIAGTSDPLTKEDADAIAFESGLSNIASVAMFSFTTRKASVDGQEEQVTLYGMNSAAHVILKPELVYGEFLSEAHDQGINAVAVIGIDVAEAFFGENTDPVGEMIRIDDTRFRIIGVTKSSGLVGAQFNNSISIPFDTMASRILGNDSVDEIDVSVYDEEQMNQTMVDVEEFLRERRDVGEDDESGFTMQSQADALETVQTITGLLTAMVAGISGISLVVGGVGIMNIMLVTVSERTKEIGLLKAIGAKQNDILVQFLVEAVTLSMAGGIIGIVVGASGAFLVSQVANIPFILSPFMVILAVGVSSLVGIVFGLYPARRAARLHPIDALRHE